jgi:hypothetical protein
LKKHPSGAKAHFDIAVFMYGLKPVPFKLKPVNVGAKAPTYQPVPFKLTHYRNSSELMNGLPAMVS